MRHPLKRLVPLLLSCLFLAGCTSAADGTGEDDPAGTPDTSAAADTVSASAEGLAEVTDTMSLQYADQFSVQYLADGSKLLKTGSDRQILLLPEGGSAPAGLSEDITVVQRPLKSIYLVASAAMDYFRSLDAIDTITLSSQKESSWTIPEAVEAMENGSLVYAGKYSAPDYELILSYGCDLAIENTMIYHTPEVIEQLEGLGIPVIIERSSYEQDPLGRLEWIKFYGALLDKEDEACEIFDSLCAQLEPILNEPATGKTVAFFYITTTGAMNVRTSVDYVAKAINMAGGTYLSFDTSDADSSLSTTSVQMEAFYNGARDADVLIYNSTITGELSSLQDLLAKSSMLSDFKAVQEGSVWIIEKNFYQESLSLGDFIQDVHTVLTEDSPDESELHFLRRLS